MDGKERALVVYASSEGQAQKVAERIATGIRATGMSADLYDAAEAPDGLAPYQLVVAGGSVHAGKHQHELEAFVRAHREELQRTASAFFSVSLSAVGKDAKHQEDARRMADGLLKATGWQPGTVALVGGALRYTRYSWLKRWVMRRIARAEHAETDTSRDWEYTDWAAVDRFAADAVALVAGRPASR